MNRNFALSLVVACAAAGPAVADDITIDPHPFVSTLTRAQVRQELHQSRQGGMSPWAGDYHHIAAMDGSRTRAEVSAEFVAERNAVAALNGEDSGSSYLILVAANKAQAQHTEIARADKQPAQAD